MQNGGFLGLLASLGIPLISSLISGIMGKGLQVRSRTSNPAGAGIQMEPPKGKGLQMEPPGSSYRRIPFYGDGLQMKPSKCKKKS